MAEDPSGSASGIHRLGVVYPVLTPTFAGWRPMSIPCSVYPKWGKTLPLIPVDTRFMGSPDRLHWLGGRFLEPICTVSAHAAEGPFLMRPNVCLLLTCYQIAPLQVTNSLLNAQSSRSSNGASKVAPRLPYGLWTASGGLCESPTTDLAATLSPLVFTSPTVPRVSRLYITSVIRESTPLSGDLKLAVLRGSKWPKTQGIVQYSWSLSIITIRPGVTQPAAP